MCISWPKQDIVQENQVNPVETNNIQETLKNLNITGDHILVSQNVKNVETNEFDVQQREKAIQAQREHCKYYIKCVT